MSDGYQQAIDRALAKELREKSAVSTLMREKYVFLVHAMGKPRMTQQDKWKKRDCTTRYWKYKDELVFAAKELNFIAETILCNYYHLVFYLSMPESWSESKKAEMNGTLHRTKPDKDNLEKGFLDCLLGNDAVVADSRTTKYWCQKGQERIEVITT